MRLSDIMSQMGLESYAEVGLIIFLAVFAAIAVRLLWFSNKEEMAHASRLPLGADVESATAKRRDHSAGSQS
jgi:cbb3-type cytochrome oxidase subunit 3